MVWFNLLLYIQTKPYTFLWKEKWPQMFTCANEYRFSSMPLFLFIRVSSTSNVRTVWRNSLFWHTCAILFSHLFVYQLISKFWNFEMENTENTNKITTESIKNLSHVLSHVCHKFCFRVPMYFCNLFIYCSL